MKKLFFLLIVSYFLICPVRAQCASLIDDPGVVSGIRMLEAWIESQMAHRDLPGMSVGIVYDRELVWARGFGYADREKKIPASTSTIYRIASISKLFTSIAVMKLRDEGKLQLDDPVGKHIPWFKIQNSYPDTPIITIRHLLTHTSGLPREAAFPYWTDFNFPTREQIIKTLPGQETIYPSETKWKYSNLALSLAGEIVAAVPGEPYADYIHRNILEPLGMTSTTVNIDEGNKKLAVGYGRRMPDGTRAIMPFTESRGITPAANLSSTVEDFARFASWQFRLREKGGREILKASTLKEMHRVHWLQPDWTSGWGLGFEVLHTPERDIVGHDGHVGGYQTAFYISPEEKVAVIALTNADDGNPYPGSPFSVVDRAFEWVAPAITRAVEPPPEAVKAHPEWSRYVGKYRIWWGDFDVLILNGKLVLINPQEPDPTDSMLTLTPVVEHTFRIDGEGFGELGEPVVFELGPDGKVKRMKVGENYVERNYEL